MSDQPDVLTYLRRIEEKLDGLRADVDRIKRRLERADDLTHYAAAATKTPPGTISEPAARG